VQKSHSAGYELRFLRFLKCRSVEVPEVTNGGLEFASHPSKNPCTNFNPFRQLF